MRILSVSVLTLFLLAGCGDDDAGPSDAGVPAAQCVADADVALLQPFLTDGGVGISNELNDLLRSCGLTSCSNELLGGTVQEAEDCMSACYETTAIAGLSRGCQDCWTLTAICTGQQCTTLCLGTDPAMCDQCVIENCVGLRNYCSGIF